MRVKVCGITRYEDARLALDHGAWALGFIFHPPSPRHVTPEKAAQIASRLPPGALTVGVFVDVPLADVQATAERVRLGGVQLHGGETPEYAAAVRAGLVIKAFRVKPGFDPERVLEYGSALVLLDAYREGAPGGTGERFDWAVAREAGRRAPIILAGGLRPENVAEALEAARPQGIDVSSGLEARAGEKDPGKVRDLFAAVARWEAERETRVKDNQAPPEGGAPALGARTWSS